MTIYLMIALWLGLGVTPSIEYELLHKEVSRVGGVGYGYAISVEICLKDEDLQRLICEVIAKEKPSGYDRLTISVYHQLHQYVPAISNEALVQLHLEHLIGVYAWNNKLLGKPHSRLVVAKDNNCKSYEGRNRDLDFNHTADCQKPARGNCGGGRLRP